MNETMQLSLLRERFYRRERRSVPATREFVRAAVADWGLGARLDDVLLCVSELATNALVHGVPPGRGYLVRLLLREGGAALRVEVHDSGDGEPVVREPGAGPEGESGRGLLIVAAMADRWGVGERNPGKIVWCEFGVWSAGGA
ncbi:ATP-binding protein [Streptomyces sp. NPDC052042]|uniref:ATP-binding protein n=1 Tax=Streptomyces sp. NPDC052042 TaxID=3365683 RepID=UPI0037CD0702